MILSDEDEDEAEADVLWYQKKLLKTKLLHQENEKARVAVIKFLEENPDINIDCVKEQLKSLLLSTTACAKKLGISPKAFFRLRKKYNIVPVSTIKNNERASEFAPHFSKKAIKNFYNINQLQRITQADIDLVQTRAARSLKLPNKVVWVPRGYHANGKLKARTEYLNKYGIYSYYHSMTDKYHIRKDNKELILSKKEVDSLNLKYSRLKGFV